MRLRILWLNLLFGLVFVIPVFAYNFDNGYDKGKLTAQDVTVDTSGFSLNLSAADVSVQHALNTLDQLIAGGGGGTPGGSNRQLQYNNSGSFGGITLSGTDGTNIGIGTFNSSGGRLIVMGGNVGINTLLPNSRLNVNGDIRMTSGSTLRYGQSVSEGGTGFSIDATDGASMSTGGQFIGMRYFYNAATDLLNLKGSNVGIGLQSPVSTFAVAGQASIGATYAGSNTAPTNGLLVQGNVGIATVNANQKLTVAGTIYSTSGGIQFPDNTTQTTAATAGTNYWNLSPGNVGINTTLNVGIGSTAPGTALDVFGSARILNSGHLTVEGVTSTGATGTGKFVFDGTPTLVTPVIGAATGTSLALTGNVGLGGGGVATNPLQVTGNGSISGFLGVGIAPSSGSHKLLLGSSAGTDIVIDANSGGNDYTLGIDPTQSNNFIIGAGSSITAVPIMAFSPSGLVGIGDYTPDAGLEINPSTMTLSGKPIFAVDSTATGDTGNGDTFIILSTTGNNVGIGSVLPPNKLYVAGTMEGQGFKLNNGASPGYVLTSNTVGVGTWMPASGGGGSGTVNSGTASQVTRYASTGTTVSGSTLVYDDLTNVGIGTVTPMAIVNISSTANQDLFRVDDNATNDLSPFVINKDGNVGIGTTNTQTDKLLVMGGNVGIGTWVPNQTLDVKGAAIISGNVGIGTISPAAFLNVASPIAQDLFRVDDNGTGDPSPFLIDLNGNVGMGTTLTTTAGLSVMNGNVGIGTWIPTQSLTVNNSINTLGNTGNSYLNSTGGNVGIGTTIPMALLHIGGNAFLDRTTSAIIMREPDGTCGTCTLSNAEVFSCASITCP